MLSYNFICFHMLSYALIHFHTLLYTFTRLLYACFMLNCCFLSSLEQQEVTLGLCLTGFTLRKPVKSSLMRLLLWLFSFFQPFLKSGIRNEIVKRDRRSNVHIKSGLSGYSMALSRATIPI